MSMKIISQIKISDPSLSEEQILEKILSTRNIPDMDAFLNPPSPLTLSLKDFGFSAKDINIAISLLKKMKEENKPVIVYTDYDADGITGGSILWEALHLMGFNAMPYVPHRQLEGYGFSIKGIDAILEKHNPGLIISVDHGIAAVDQIAYAKGKGIPVIVTDHHAKQEKIPDSAEVIFHIPALSGSGVAYFFAKEVFTELAKPEDKNYKKLENHFKTDYLALASIGTVADLVPLVGPSRSIVKYGLKSFNECQRTGLAELMKEAKIEGHEITPYEIGFIIAPRINAIGRLEHALDALRLLCTPNKERARELASKVGQLNEDRKSLVDKAVKEAKKQVNDMILTGSLPKILILKSDDWHEGIIGLIASKMVEAYQRPTLVVTKAEQYLKASARSPATVHLTEFLGKLKHHLVAFGGHRQAAGFSIEADKFDQFKKEAEELAEKTIKDEDLVKAVMVEIELPLTLLSMALAERLSQLEPFGIGNSKPTFVCPCKVFDTKLMGKKKEHMRLSVSDPVVKRMPFEIVAFNRKDDFIKLQKGQPIMAAFNLEINEWNGRRSLQGKLIDWE